MFKYILFLITIFSFSGMKSFEQKVLTEKDKKDLTEEEKNKINREMLSAIQENKLSELKASFEKGGDINAVINYRPLIMEATRYFKEFKDIGIIKFLIQNEADINLLSIADYYWTPLMEAIWHNNQTLVEYLIQNGADINKGSKNGTTPLMVACSIGYKEFDIKTFKFTNPIVELLINNGVDINAVELEEIEETSIEDLKTFVNNHKPTLNLNDIYDIEIIKEDGNKINKKVVGTGRTALFYAVINNHKKIVKLLLEKGAKIDIKDFEGMTVIDWAKIRAKKNILQVLYSHQESLREKEQLQQSKEKLENKNIKRTRSSEFRSSLDKIKENFKRFSDRKRSSSTEDK